tara:strand:+ start:137 stop:328 length:192 start_codon:yes stop_codon:yes gene_type:complete
MALKDKFLTKVFSTEGTEKSQEGVVEPMKPENILPIMQLAIAAFIAAICMAPIAINVIKQGGL